MSRWRDRMKKVEQLAESFQQNPLVTRYKPRLWPCQPSSIWKLFPRQSRAISFAQSCKEVVHVFALEKEKTLQGQRIFLVTSYTELWHYYRTYTQSLMHCYEVIPEGAVCKLYFDLEFYKPSNKAAKGTHMVSSLIQYVCGKLLDIYGLKCSTKDVLNLDSSTEEKFSRHLIFNLRNAAFKDNVHVGAFINAILQHILRVKKGSPSLDVGLDAATENNGKWQTEADAGVKLCERVDSPQTKRLKPGEEDLSFLQVKNKDGQDSLFVDLGVYTKNRNFRLYKSSKVGKNAAFTLADDNQFMPHSEKGVSPEESLFLASLVCNVGFTGQRILTWDGPETKECKTIRSQGQPAKQSNAGAHSGSESSPHQDVDDFILTVVNKDGVQGSIRRWNYFAVEQLLVYDIANYRWCENVGRFHKSNNIMIIVDLKEEVWYQKCHDPECRNFRSSSYPLPQEICVSYMMTLDDEEQAYSMDNAGNIEPSPAPNQTSQSQVLPEEKSTDEWGDKQDDQDYLECLHEFEQNSEISDQLLLDCLEDFESK